MDKYDYRAAIKSDIREWMRENKDEIPEDLSKEDLADWLHEVLWVEDSVTGNASGSYTFSTWVAEENLCHNLDLLEESENDFGRSEDLTPESADVQIRCYLLWDCIQEVLEEDDEHLRDRQTD